MCRTPAETGRLFPNYLARYFISSKNSNSSFFSSICRCSCADLTCSTSSSIIESLVVILYIREKRWLVVDFIVIHVENAERPVKCPRSQHFDYRRTAFLCIKHHRRKSTINDEHVPVESNQAKTAGRPWTDVDIHSSLI